MAQGFSPEQQMVDELIASGLSHHRNKRMRSARSALTTASRLANAGVRGNEEDGRRAVVYAWLYGRAEAGLSWVHVARRRWSPAIRATRNALSAYEFTNSKGFAPAELVVERTTKQGLALLLQSAREETAAHVMIKAQLLSLLAAHGRRQLRRAGGRPRRPYRFGEMSGALALHMIFLDVEEFLSIYEQMGDVYLSDAQRKYLAEACAIGRTVPWRPTTSDIEFMMTGPVPSIEYAVDGPFVRRHTRSRFRTRAGRPRFIPDDGHDL